MVDLSFIVNNQGVKYFKSKLNKSAKIGAYFSDAEKNKNRMILLWNIIGDDINAIIQHMFGNINFTIIVEVYPNDFLLGAINIEKGIIVLGQPSRSRSFYGGIIIHELIHFVLKEKKVNRIVEEVICFSFERMFILEHDGIDIEEFKYEEATDDFHKHAIIFSKKIFKDFIQFYNNKDIEGLIYFINEKMDDSIKKIDIKNSLIDYLSNNE